MNDHYDIQLDFESLKNSQEFMVGVRGSNDLLSKDYRIVLPNESYQSANPTIELLLTFMENGGIEAIEAFAGVIKAGFTYLTARELVKIRVRMKKGGKSVEVDKDMSVKELANKLKENL